MNHEFKELSTGAILSIKDQILLNSFLEPKQLEYYTFIWSKAQTVSLIIDSIPLNLEPYSILALTPNQYLQVNSIEEAVIYQFNREFYCIKDHDKEVSCSGILFFGNSNIPVIHLNNNEQRKFETLHDIFIDELQTKDNIQAEMLRMLLARFIIKTTRLLKIEIGSEMIEKNAKMELLRAFNVLVETHFKTEHSVSFYANKLFKSPKTLSNTFAKLNTTPLQIIHARIVLEIKRLLIYTNKSAKEIAYDVGFEDASHLSRLFKKHTLLSPSAFRQQL